MTSITHRSDNDRDIQTTLSRDASKGPSKSLRPATEATSDSEKPVREKLKKTSIASISQHAMADQDIASETHNPMEIASADQMDPVSGEGTNSKDADLIRGRPVRKRSFDDLEAADVEKSSTPEVGQRQEMPNGHARKRSRDIRTGEPLKGDGRLRVIDVPVHEEGEDATGEKASYESLDSGSEKAVDAATEPLSRVEIEPGSPSRDSGDTAPHKLSTMIEHTAPEADIETLDHEMRDSTASPRKKRSRDQFDSEAEREQKIPATEEARAHRRSDEIDRSEDLSLGNEDDILPEDAAYAEKHLNGAEVDSTTTDVDEETDTPPSRIFGATSTFSDTTASKRSQTSSEFTTQSKDKSIDQQPQSSTKTFASSSFAALAQSGTSPFGALGAQSTNANAPSPFSSSSAFSPKKSFPTEVDSTKAEPAASSGFGAFASASSSGFGVAQPSPFGASGAVSNNVFGGSVFGGGFGGGFGGANKLSNFASPNGDARVGNSHGSIKPIGSPKRKEDDDDDDQSDSDGEGTGEKDRDEGGDEADTRFQHQDGEKVHLPPKPELTNHSRDWRRWRGNCSLFAGYFIHFQRQSVEGGWQGDFQI